MSRLTVLPDRRIRKTKLRLKQALLELIDEQQYDAITIHDITRRADVGRSTFYSHFDSKEELLFDGFDDWLLSLAELPATAFTGDGAAAGGAGFRFSLPLLQHVRGREQFFRAVFVQSGAVGVRQKFTTLLAKVVRRELDRMARSATSAAARNGAGVDAVIARDAYAHTVAAAFLGLASWWMTIGQKLSAETVDTLFQESTSSFCHA